MKLTQPIFCTTVSPSEYDFVEQFDNAMKAANEFHKGIAIDEKCPPPYYPVDMGKVYGLVAEVIKLQVQLAEAASIIEIMRDEMASRSPSTVYCKRLADGFLKKLEDTTA